MFSTSLIRKKRICPRSVPGEPSAVTPVEPELVQLEQQVHGQFLGDDRRRLMGF